MIIHLARNQLKKDLKMMINKTLYQLKAKILFSMKNKIKIMKMKIKMMKKKKAIMRMMNNRPLMTIKKMRSKMKILRIGLFLITENNHLHLILIWIVLMIKKYQIKFMFL